MTPVMKFIDIHTHNKSEETTYAIFNSNGESTTGCTSVGIHPWDVDNNWEERFRTIRELAKAPNVVAIGECGIDRVHPGAAPELQAEVFRAHITLSEELKKPLIIHCVKAVDNIISQYKECKPQQAWIIHGFRGKPQQAEQLTRAGLYLSLGEHFNAESAKIIPADKLFIESDESSTPVEEIYAAVAAARECSTAELVCQTSANAERCGIRFI
ncbi:MAG: hypothetical protein E7086_02940 [Bacteroidales bacterium]|nr:hypothetical protein [Bacteroidales bacterium]